MTRGKKLLLLLIALIAVCAAAFIATKLAPDITGEEDTGETIFTLDTADLANLTWVYEGEEMSFDYDSGEEVWSYAPDADFPLTDSYLTLMATALADVSALRTMELAADAELADYGLEEPALTVTVTTADGTATTFRVGDESTLGGEVYLLMLSGEGDTDTIYLVDYSFPTYFAYSLYDLVDTEDTPAISNVTAFTVEGDTQSYTLDYIEDSGLTYTDEYVWYLEDGEGYVTLDTELAEALIANVSGLVWSSCFNYRADDDELAAYGLDTPSVVATIYYTASEEVDTGEVDEDGEAITETQESRETFALEIGSYYTGDDGSSYCYARISGSRMVYLIDAAICDTLLYTTADDLLPDEVILMDWDGVTRVDASLNGTDYTFLRTAAATEDEDGGEEVFQLNGVTVELEDILGSLESIGTSDSAANVTPERAEALALTFYQDRDGYETVTLTFYVYDSDSYLTQRDGRSTLFADAADVDSVISALEAVISGEDTEK